MFEWITGFVEQSGYPGIAFLMFLENVFPPIPSELIMPLAGFVASNGKLNLWLVILAGSAGSLASTLIWYYVGRWLNVERLKRWTRLNGRWITMTPDDVDKATEWFDRHGGKAVLIGRLVPTVRTLISVPAGLANIGLGRFLAWSAIGTMLWTAMLAGAGYFLGNQHDKVAAWMSPVSNAVVAILVAVYLYRVVTFRRHVKKA